MDCLKNVVGITRSDNDCYNGAFTANDKKSRSGFYMDDATDGLPLKFPANAIDSDESDLPDMMRKAQKEGLQNFKLAYTVTAAHETDRAFRNVQGVLCDGKGNGYLNQSGNVGIKINPTSIRGGYFSVDAVSINVNTPGTYTVKFQAEGFPISAPPIDSVDITVNGSGWVMQKLDEPVNLPFYQHGVKQNYFIFYDLNGAQPRNSKVRCNCGRSYRWWDQFMEPKGWAENGSAKSRFNHGVRLHGSVGCSGISYLCTLNKFDDEYGLTVAKSLQLYQINAMMSRILSSSRINSYTTLDKPLITKRYERNLNQLKEFMKYLVTNVPAGASDCLKCKERIIKGKIRI